MSVIRQRMYKTLFINKIINAIMMVIVMAGICISCKKVINSDTTITRIEDTVPDKEDGNEESYAEGQYENDNFDTFITSSASYSIAYLGTINSKPVEMNLVFNMINDSVSGNFFKDEGRLTYGPTIEGIVSKSGYVLRTDDYSGNVGHLKLKEQNILTGTWQPEGKTENEAAMLKPLQDIRENRQIDYIYKIVTTSPDKDEVPELSKDKKLEQVIIYDSKKKYLQTLNFKDQFIYNEQKFLTLKDYNFDGYLDLDVEVHYPFAIKDETDHIFYLYSQESKMFIENKELSDLHWVKAYYSKKEIESSDADGSGNEFTNTYQWVENNLLLTSEIRSVEGDEKTYYKEYTIQNGKSILTKEYSK